MSSDYGPGVLPSDPEAVEADKRLVRAIEAGDREAEREFALRFLSPLRAMLVARSRDPELSADLLQDVMIEAICALRRGQLREPAKLKAFVAAIGRNVLNKHYLRSARRPVAVELLVDLPDLRQTGDEQEELVRGELALEAIASLETVDRTILEMTLVSGFKPGAIARQLQLNPDMVRQRKTRAIRKVVDFVMRRSQKGNSIHLVEGQRP